MEEKVFGAKAIWTPKIFWIIYFFAGLALIFSVITMDVTAIISIVVASLLLRVLYEFLMSSLKSTEHLYRIAEATEMKSREETE